jgi:hypothetical protein
MPCFNLVLRRPDELPIKHNFIDKSRKNNSTVLNTNSPLLRLSGCRFTVSHPPTNAHIPSLSHNAANGNSPPYGVNHPPPKSYRVDAPIFLAFPAARRAPPPKPFPPPSPFAILSIRECSFRLTADQA